MQKCGSRQHSRHFHTGRESNPGPRHGLNTTIDPAASLAAKARRAQAVFAYMGTTVVYINTRLKNAVNYSYNDFPLTDPFFSLLLVNRTVNYSLVR